MSTWIFFIVLLTHYPALNINSMSFLENGCTNFNHSITNKATNAANSILLGLNSYYEKAAGTPTGQKLVDFYTKSSQQVQDIHAEARRLADLKKKDAGSPSTVPGTEKTSCKCGSSSSACNCASGSCACADCAKSDVKTVASTNKTTCGCGGDAQVCGCAAGSCACGSCPKSELKQVEGNENSTCKCGGSDSTCLCASGKCACSGCAK